MLESRIDQAAGVGQRDPELNAVQGRVVLGRRLLGVRDASPGRHQVELTRPDQLLGAQAVPVQHVPCQQPGDRLEADVRMRRHVHPGHAVDVHRAVVIDEAPGADAAAQPEGQHATHRHRTDAGIARLGQFKVIYFGNGVACHLHVRFDSAHRRTPFGYLV